MRKLSYSLTIRYGDTQLTGANNRQTFTIAASVKLTAPNEY